MAQGPVEDQSLTEQATLYKDFKKKKKKKNKYIIHVCKERHELI